ncbi:hypothetical protein HA49_23225 [Tatumella morbirosei]|uniref:Uncharacterized protein n=1 Tax=Tatumella morbirosei TaxID=642227 RepID=A0A0F5BUV4_9GAMM|nr:hypothetical protein [Tatumella morbirosei]KKA63528.1 hypothetical protein HA49_23225 [Tatumella morbirosei]
MKRKGNILNQIEEEIEKVEQVIDKNKKQIKERKFIRNTVISSISKDVLLMNDQWKTYLVKLKNEISDAGFLKKYIKQFELSPITKDEFIACFDFLFDLNISSMRFSKKIAEMEFTHILQYAAHVIKITRWSRNGTLWTHQKKIFLVMNLLFLVQDLMV